MIQTKTEQTTNNLRFARILAAIDSDHLETETFIRMSTTSLSGILSLMIKKGVSFDVAENCFELCKAECLSHSEKQFLSINQDFVLVTLQQALLVRYCFSRSDHLLSDFASEIEQRRKFISERTNGSSLEIYYQAVSGVTKIWFTQLLKQVTR